MVYSITALLSFTLIYKPCGGVIDKSLQDIYSFIPYSIQMVGILLLYLLLNYIIYAKASTVI